jgi:predicted SAM-dependent methyltransferase
VKLNLGSGYNPQQGYINIDNNSETNPDVLNDIVKDGLCTFDDDTVDEVLAKDFLEHIPAGEKVIFVITEIWRVLKHGGLFLSITPDAEHGQGAFQDPYHISFWCENSWLYYSHPEYRKLYSIKANFSIDNIARGGNEYRRVQYLQVAARAVKNGENKNG